MELDLHCLTCLHGVHSDKFTFPSVDEFQVKKSRQNHMLRCHGGWKVKRTEGCTGVGDKSTRIANNMYINKQNQTNI